MRVPMFHGIVSVPTTTPSWTTQFLVTRQRVENAGIGEIIIGVSQ
jgi:hypothetical protein